MTDQVYSEIVSLANSTSVEIIFTKGGYKPNEFVCFAATSGKESKLELSYKILKGRA